jgi:hypothetical protein
MRPNPRLKEFLLPYDEHIQKLTISLRNFVTELIPEANELIWDNYSALAMAYSKSEKLKDAFCHIAVYDYYVNFGFNRGTELKTNKIKLKGTGKLIRHLTVKDLDSFPKNEVEEMIWEAVGISEQRNAELVSIKSKGKSIVMSVSEKKRRPKN